jgi:membrane-bound lytic murein transglycosylase B
MEGRAPPGSRLLHRPPPPSASLVRRLRAGGAGVAALLAWTVAAPGFAAGGAPATGAGPAGPVVAVTSAGEPSADELGRLGALARERGREAAAAAERDRAAVRRAAGGAGATVTPTAGVVPDGGDRAIPALALRAYREAAAWAAGFDPECRLSWAVLAGIGRIESNHGLFGGPATRFSAAGTISPRITGPPLDGRGVAAIGDSDGGRWDRDTVWDRAVGPMQFIPTTWRSLGRDGNGDRVADPNNLFDAAVSAAGYLCLSGGGSLADPARLGQAIHGYNHSWAYVRSVLGWARLYQGGVTTGPAVPAGQAAPATTAAPSTATPTTGPPGSGPPGSGPPGSDPTTTTRRPTTTEPPTTTTTTRRPTTTAPATTTTRPPTTTGPSTSGATSTTGPCRPTTTSTTTGGSTTTPSTTTTTLSTTTTTTGGSTTTSTTTLPPCH